MPFSRAVGGADEEDDVVTTDSGPDLMTSWSG